MGQVVGRLSFQFQTLLKETFPNNEQSRPIKNSSVGRSPACANPALVNLNDVTSYVF